MHSYIDNNVQYIKKIEDTTSHMRTNQEAMVDEFERLKVGFYGFEQPPPPPPFED